MGMPKPQPQHARLKDLAGTWTAEETLFPSPWDPQGGKASGRFQSRMDLDGFFAIADYAQERGGHPSYRGHAGTLFAFEQNLRQKSPQSERRRVDGLFGIPEGGWFLGERSSDDFLRDDLGERQIRSLKKRSQHQAKTPWQRAG